MAALFDVVSVRCPVSLLDLPAGLFSRDFIGAFRGDGEHHWEVITSSKRFAYCSGGALVDVSSGHGQVWCGCCFPGSGIAGWTIVWVVEEDKLVVYHPVFNFFSHAVEVWVFPAQLGNGR